MRAISGKWKSCILIELRNGPKRPSELMKLFPEAIQRVINLQLEELDYGLIEKNIFAELPPHSEYSLTDTGRSALPILDQLDAWGDIIRPQLKKTFGK